MARLARKFISMSAEEMAARRIAAAAEAKSAAGQERSTARKEETEKRKAANAKALAAEQKALDKLNGHPPRGIKTAMGVSKFVRCEVLSVGNWKRGVA